MLARSVVGRAMAQVRAGGPCAVVQTRGFAENLKGIAKRITSTKNIQKITKSMKMVSAAKLRGDQTRLAQGRPFGSGFDKMFNSALGEEDKPLDEPKNPLYIVLTSDKGLCGGVNGATTKHTKARLDADVANGLEPRVFIVGEKGSGLMRRTHGKFVVGSIDECWKSPINFDKVMTIVDRITSFPEADSITIVYNRFKSAIAYSTEEKKATNFSHFGAMENEDGELPTPLNKYEIEYESNEEALANLFEFGLAVQLYGCCLENATAEQSSRMSAMDGASKNASEMVDSLTVRYNRARQARITTELIEIISGAESLKG